MPHCLGDKIASGEALEDAMLVARRMIFQTDEIDETLQSFSRGTDQYKSSLLKMLLSLYTEADSVHSTRIRTNRTEPQHIDQPGLVIFGTATPECYYDAMDERQLTNGLFSRSVVVDVEERADRMTSPRCLNT